MTLEERTGDATSLLRRVAERPGRAVLAGSFGAEDMVLINLIARLALPIGVFTLDTGRLPDETYALIDRVREHYRLPIEVYCPDATELERFVGANGPDAFYRSVELRLACCTIRKTAPLARALAGKNAWITGHRPPVERRYTTEGAGAARAEHERYRPRRDYAGPARVCRLLCG